MKIFSVLVLSLALSAITSAEEIPPSKIFGSEEHVDIVRKATSCEAQRIAVEYVDSRDISAGLKITSKGDIFVLKPEMLSLLKSTLLRPYEDSNASKFCMPVPGIRYTLRDGKRSVSVLVCYRCRILIVEENGRVVGGRGADDLIESLRKVAASFLSPEEVAKLP